MMKLRVSLYVMTMFLMSTRLLGQVQTVNESFESWPAQNWSTYTLGAGNGWTEDWQGISHTGDHSALANINNSQCDSWLVSPQVIVGTDNYEMRFWEINIDSEYFDFTAINISTGSPNPEEGDYTEIYVSENAPTDWTERIIDLSAYQGQNIYLAFQHIGTWHSWLIDDVIISPSDYTDISINEVINPNGVDNQGAPEDVILRIRNNGTSLVNVLDVEWSINSIAQPTYNATSLNLESEEEIELSVGNFDFSESGFYIIEATINTDGDEIVDNNFFSSIYHVSNFKDAALVRVKPEGMHPNTGIYDVKVEVSNAGENIIDSLMVMWQVNELSQPTFQINSLGLAPGESAEINIGTYDFSTGVHDVLVELNALGDTNEENDIYLAYAAIDTLWESFEGYDFPPANWSINFGVRDNVNFGTPKHGQYYYSTLPDENYFGEVVDTLFTPFLSIENGDIFNVHIETSGFLDAIHHLIAKDVNGTVTILQELTGPINNWVELELDISSVEGIKRLGIASAVEDGPGHTRIDLITSTASLHQFQNDLSIVEGEIYFLAKQNELEEFTCTINNSGIQTVIGGDYSINLVDDSGTVLASSPGQIIASQEEITITIPFTFNIIESRKLHFDLVFLQDDYLGNNKSIPTPVYVVPNTVVLNETGSKDFTSLNLPFNGNGNTNSLGEDDISQSMFYPEQFGNSGNIYGFIYSYNNILNVQEPKRIPLKVWASQSANTDLSDGFIPTSEMILVFDDTLDFRPGEREVYVSFIEPLAYNGLENLVIQNYQYDPTWPPAMFSICNTDMPNDGIIRSVTALDVYQLDPNIPVEFYNSLKDIPYTQFVIDPILDFGVISGQVLSSDAEPLENVEIVISNSSIVVTTDVNGFYTLPELPYGTYELTALITGYDDEIVNVNLDSPTLTQDFVLTSLIPIEIIGIVVGSNAPSEGLENVQIQLSGYSEFQTNSGPDGTFTLSNVFSNSDYQVNLDFYGYEPVIISLNSLEENIDLGEIILIQKFISPHHVQAQLGSENVELIWNSPQEGGGSIIQNDLNVCSYSYTNESNENVWLGNIFEISELTTLTDVEFKSDIYQNANDFVSVDVFDMSGNLLASSEPFLIFPDSLYVVDIPNIVVTENVFAAVHWQNNPISTNALCVDFSDENITNSAAIKYEGQNAVLLSEFFGDGTPNLSFLVRVRTLINADNENNGENLSFNVYRGLASEFPDLTNWIILNESPVFDLTYLDAEWDGIDANLNYRYAIETIYNEGFSEVTFSNSTNGIGVGLEEIESNLSIQIYPNPSNDFIRISFESDLYQSGMVEVFDYLGKRVFQDLIIQSHKIATINTSSLNAGVYMVRLNFNGFIVTKKLVKE